MNKERAIKIAHYLFSAICFCYGVWGYGYLNLVGTQNAYGRIYGTYYPGIFLFKNILGLEDPATPTSVSLAFIFASSVVLGMAVKRILIMRRTLVATRKKT